MKRDSLPTADRRLLKKPTSVTSARSRSDIAYYFKFKHMLQIQIQAFKKGLNMRREREREYQREIKKENKEETQFRQ